MAFSLALSGLVRKRRATLLTLAALAVSFAAGIVSLSLLGSISKTNAEFRLNTYGAWFGAIPNGKDGDVQWLSGQEWFDDVGTAILYGEASIPDTAVKYGVGHLDEGYTEIGRLTLDEGRWPQADNEVAVEAGLLRHLGYENVCGQEITLNIAGFTHVGWDDILTDELQRTFETPITLEVCGIIHDYSRLWVLNSNRDNLPLVGAVVTAPAGEAIMAKISENFISSHSNPVFSLSQYFFTAKGDGSNSNVILETNKYLRSSRQDHEDRTASYNHFAYPDIHGGSSETVYQYLILAVTLFAVLCIYILQYPREVHTYAVFRAIGASRWKLLGLIMCETVLVCIPATVLGGAVGAAATWAALKLSVFHGSSVHVWVVIPWRAVFRLAALWAFAVLLSRFLVFAAAVRMPLTGRFKMQNRRALWVRRFRSGLVIVLRSLAVFAALYATLSYPSQHVMIDSYMSYPCYKVKDDNGISEEDMELFGSVPGVASLDGFNSLPVKLSLSGEDEMAVELYAIDENAWSNTFSFKSAAQRESFHRGEFVFIVVPEDAARLSETCVISVYDGKNGGGNFLLSVEVPARSTAKPTGTANRTRPFEPYTVICSHAFVESILASMEPGKRWGNLKTGDEYSYGTVYLVADRSAKDLSTDISLEHLCFSMDWSFSNNRNIYQGIIQLSQQTLILAVSVGLCTVLVSVMILWSIMSLEADQERLRFGLLRTLGMSMRQVRSRLLKVAAIRSLTCVVLGCLLHAAWNVYSELTSSAASGQGDVPLLKRLFSGVLLNFTRQYRAYYISAVLAGAIILFMLAVISKYGLLKGGADDVHDITSAGTV